MLVSNANPLGDTLLNFLTFLVFRVIERFYAVAALFFPRILFLT